MTEILENFLSRQRMMDEYEPSGRLECKRMDLIVPDEGLLKNFGKGRGTWGWEKNKTDNFTVHNVRGTHDSCVRGDNALAIANIVNRSNLL